ncbi:antibiotic biosynthesis monooxygenase [Kitasatospora sp. NPDC097643]|uniref:antibiotic biosynthesis monooxygenase family protein n=1 Tax=Kitasatospora sp. NPDC097643 TaxID=3157230 RepID=UPI003327F7B3
MDRQEIEEELDMAKQPVQVILRMEIAPGKEAEFEEVWLDIGRRIARTPANRGQSLVRVGEQDGGALYFVLTEWADEEAFRAFEHSAEHVEHRRRLGAFRTGGDMVVARIVHDLRAERV